MPRIETHPPADTDAERAILGAVMIDGPAIEMVAGIIRPEAFYSEAHARIFQAMLNLNASGQPVDFVTLTQELDKTGHLDGVGGPAYITGLITATPTSVHAEYYAGIVAELSRRRRLIEIAGQMAVKAYRGDSSDVLQYAHRALTDIDAAGIGGLVHVKTVAGELYDKVEKWSQNPLELGQVRGLATGIPHLDYSVGGLEPGWLVLVAGRPGMGKSALAFDIARRVASRNEYVAIFSLEMPKADVLARWASAISGVGTRNIRRGVCPAKYRGGPYAEQYVTDEQLSRYMDALSAVSEMQHVWIDDSRALSASDIRARSMRQARRFGGLDLIVVDHTGRMKATGASGENTAKVEGRKSRELSDLAGELQCPVVLVQQLNREVGSRQNKQPTLTDLRDSGEHEENAHVILGLHRDSYYMPTLTSLDLDVLLLKHREGPAGSAVKLRYERHISRFSEYERQTK